METNPTDAVVTFDPLTEPKGALVEDRHVGQDMVYATPTVIDPHHVNDNILVAVLLRVGGITLNDAEIERAKTHTLTIERKDQLNGPTITLVGAAPTV